MVPVFSDRMWLEIPATTPEVGTFDGESGHAANLFNWGLNRQVSKTSVAERGVKLPVSRRSQFMSAPTVNTVDPAWKGAYRAGGVALILSGVMFLLVLYLGATLGVPSTGADLLVQAGQKATVAAVDSMSILFDLLGIFGGLAHYLALKNVRKSSMLIAVTL